MTPDRRKTALELDTLDDRLVPAVVDLTTAGAAGVAGGAVTVMLDARLNHGSGSGDMFLLVPDTAFATAAPGTYVYLYTKMGATAGATANSGFEEWAVRTDTSAPSVGVSTLAGSVYYD